MSSQKLLFLGFLVMACSFWSGVSLAANQSADMSFWSESDNEGGASYIVEYEVPSSKQSQNSPLSSQIIEDIDSVFKQSLSMDMRSKVSHSFGLVPGAVMELTQNEYNQIANNPLVKGVYRNKARRLNLAESKNVVFRGGLAQRHSGKGQTVAILDTGVDNQHPFFISDGISRIVSQACYTRGGFSSAFREIRTLCPNGGRIQIGEGAGDDCSHYGFSGCDHGTHVAGIAAGNDGIANEANIIAINVFTGIRDVFYRNVCGTGFGQNCVVAFDSDIIFGLERVYALRDSFNIAAVNMSLGGGEFLGGCDFEVPAVTSVINRLKEAGIATIVSSGNSGFSNAVSYPACVSNAIAVGATSDFNGLALGQTVVQDERVFYSNSASALDLYAPGTLIRSSVPNNSFSNFNGTSMAAPHVAGAFVVVKSENPELSVDEIESVFKSVGPTVEHSGVERRRLDIAAALRKLGLLKTAIPQTIIPLLLED